MQCCAGHEGVAARLRGHGPIRCGPAAHDEVSLGNELLQIL